MADTYVIEADALERMTAGIIAGMGAPPDIVTEVSRHLVRSNLSGHDSHGVLRIPAYVQMMDSDDLRPAERAVVGSRRGVTAIVDARRGFGHHAAAVAMRWCLEVAPELGVAAAAVRHSTHIGRLGEYTEMAAEAGLIGIVTIGMAGLGVGLAAPFRGRQRFMSTNPWSIGIPAADGRHFVFDAATTALAEGKVRVALAGQARLPEGALLDPEGQPTIDPAQLYQGGSLLAFGGAVAGHKGYGLSLASALIGSLAIIDDPEPTTAGASRRAAEPGHWVAGVFVIAIDPSFFGPLDSFRAQTQMVLDLARKAPPAAEAPVLVAGDPERQSRITRLASGIPIAGPTWRELVEVAARFGVPVAPVKEVA